MVLIKLGPNIILLHLLPLLSEEDIRALAAVETGLFALLADVRFPTCKVSNYVGFIMDYLQPSTLQTVKDLTLNGTDTEKSIVFSSPNLRSVQSATLCGRIHRDQRAAFTRFVGQLRGLTEEQDIGDPDQLGSNLSFLPAGALSNLHVLRMELTIPFHIGSCLGFAKNLETIKFLPSFNSGTTDEDKLADYKHFAADLVYLLENISDRNLLPSLRLVHAVLGMPTVTHQPLRHSILESIWTAAAKHGGWRLFAGRTSTVPLKAYRTGWEDWWTEHATDLCLSVQEVELFSVWCERNNRFPRLDEFVVGRIHIHFPIEFEAAGNFCATKIYGITLSLGSVPNLRNAVKFITADTRSIDISLETYWGDVPTVQFSPRQFHRIEALRITGPAARTSDTPLDFSHNLAAHILLTLSARNWDSLHALSIPATALQRTTPEQNLGEPDNAACGIHIGGYDLGWLAGCRVLESLHITEWSACHECDLEDDISLVAGFQHLPRHVKSVCVTGYFSCPAHLVHAWCERVVCEMNAVLRGRRRDSLVNTRGLWFGPA